MVKIVFLPVNGPNSIQIMAWIIGPRSDWSWNDPHGCPASNLADPGDSLFFFSSPGISGCGMAGQDRTWWFLNRMFLKNDMPGFSPSVSPEPKWFPNVKKIRKIGVVFSCFYTNLPGLTNFGDTMAPNLWRLRRSQQMIRFHQSKLLMPAPQLVISISCAQKKLPLGVRPMFHQVAKSTK